MKRLVVLLMVTCLIPCISFAERIYLKSGNLLVGTIVSSDTESIDLETEYGVTHILRKDIKEEKKDAGKKRRFSISCLTSTFPLTFGSVYYNSVTPPDYDFGTPFLCGCKYWLTEKVAVKAAYFCSFNLTDNSVVQGCSLTGLYSVMRTKNPETDISIAITGAYMNKNNNSLADINSYTAMGGVNVEIFPLSQIPNLGFEGAIGFFHSWLSAVDGPGIFNGKIMGIRIDCGVSYYLF